jgi:sensor histidine kinase YesM
LQGLNKSPGYLFVKLNGQSDLPVDLRLYEKEYMELFTHRWNFNRRGYITYYAVLSAILFFTGLFFLARYFQFNEKYLLWYALYLILMGIFNLANFERTAHHMIFWEYFRLPRELQQLFRPVPWLFFCLYLRDILGIKPKSTFYGIYKWMFNAVVLSLVVCLMLFILRQVFRIPLLNQIYFYSLIPVSLASAVLAWKVNKGATSVHRFIGIGILVIALGSLIYFASGFFFPGRSNHLIIEIALLIELVFLNMAIGLKIKQTNQELLSTQKELVLAEQHNLEIQKQLNEQLQELVDQKTQKIVEKNEALIAEEKLKLAAEFDQKIATAELKALKAQMNPHFIFNCLNAIRALIQDGNSEKATDYLADFAAFIRKVLSYSEVKQITLEEELELCQLYLKMEQLRFVDGFEFEIKADEGTAIDFIMLPPMLLQPLLENAIWHGLLHKEGDRKVSIEIAQTDSEVICKITDNGVGRAFSAELQKSSSSRKSMGMKLFKERLEINNQLLDHQYNYEIIDKLNDEQSQGTQVKLYFQL